MQAQDNVALLGATTAAAVVAATGAPFFCKGSFRELCAILSVTAAATEASDTLDVYIDATIDGGTTWINLIHFTQILGNGGAKKIVAISISAASVLFDATSDLAAAATPRSLVGATFRPRWTVVDGGGSPASFTFSINGSFKA